MNESNFIGEIYFSWKGCLTDPNNWHCNQEFSLLNISYPTKKVSGFLAVQARFMPEIIQDAQIQGQMQDIVHEIDDADQKPTGGGHISEKQREYLEEQRKYMELQKQYMKQQEKFMKMQGVSKVPIKGNQDLKNERKDTFGSERQKQFWGEEEELEAYELSSNIDQILRAEDDQNNTYALEQIDSDIDFLNAKDHSLINLQDTSIQIKNRVIINNIDKKYEMELADMNQNNIGKINNKINNDEENLIDSMNSDIDQLLNTSEMGNLNQEDLNAIDSNLDISNFNFNLKQQQK